MDVDKRNTVDSVLLGNVFCSYTIVKNIAINRSDESLKVRKNGKSRKNNKEVTLYYGI